MLRFGVGLTAAVLFVLAGVTAINEVNQGGSLGLSVAWFSFAMAAAALALSLPPELPRRRRE